MASCRQWRVTFCHGIILLGGSIFSRCRATWRRVCVREVITLCWCSTTPPAPGAVRCYKQHSSSFLSLTTRPRAGSRLTRAVMDRQWGAACFPRPQWFISLRCASVSVAWGLAPESGGSGYGMGHGLVLLLSCCMSCRVLHFHCYFCLFSLLDLRKINDKKHHGFLKEISIIFHEMLL